MVDPRAVFVWAWDARPYPAFPDQGSVWADAGNWRVGHWITGRIEGCDLDRLIPKILADLGVDVPVAIEAAAYLDGTVIDRPLSARAALEPLAQLYGLDVSAVAGTLQLRGPRREAAAGITEDDLVRVSDDEAPLRRVRAEESGLPRSVEIGFTDSENPDYRRASAAAIRPAGGRRRETRIEAAIVTRRETAESLAEALLDRAIAGRDTAGMTLSPRRLEFEPGDLLSTPAGLQRVVRIDDGPAGRWLETRGVPLHGPGSRPARPASVARPVRPPVLAGAPFALALDLPADRWHADGAASISRPPPSPGPARWRSGARTGRARPWRSTAPSTIRPASAAPWRRCPPGRSGASTARRASMRRCATPAPSAASACLRCSRAATCSR